MKLYSTNGTQVILDPEFGEFFADEQGAFVFPDELAARIHNIHFDGRPAWEDDVQRHNRLVAAEAARRSDPATLLDEVAALRESLGARPLTAKELREAEDERRRIASEREAEAEALIKAAEERERAIAERDTKEAAAEAEAVAKAEAAEAAKQAQAAAEALAAERGIVVGELAHVADYGAIEGVVEEILVIAGVASARLDTGDAGPLEQLVAGERPAAESETPGEAAGGADTAQTAPSGAEPTGGESGSDGGQQPPASTESAPSAPEDAAKAAPKGGKKPTPGA